MPVRCLLFGVGEVGLAAARMLLGKGVAIAGCYTRSRYLGRDLGEVVGLGRKGTVIESAERFVPSAVDADVALFSTTSGLEDLFGAATACLAAGIDVVTIAEDALFPWSIDPATAAELDRIARAGGATLTATGVNDAAMTHGALIAASYMPGPTRIESLTVGNFGRLGPATLAALPLGMPGDEARAAFAAELEPGKTPHTYSTPVVEALLSLGGFIAAGPPAITLEPVLGRSPLSVPQVGLTIQPGQVCGIAESTTVTTRDGLVVSVALVGKVFEDGDEEMLRVTVHGDAAPITLKIAPLPSIESTAALAVNRIPDAIAAPPGYQTLDKLGTTRLSAWR